jgi:hypothetical protein
MAKKVILAINFEDNRVKQLKLLGMMCKAATQAVNEDEKGQTIGAILGLTDEEIQAISSMAKPVAEETVHDMVDSQLQPPVTLEAIVFVGFESAEVTKVLTAIRKGPLKNIALKAMVTPNNITWTVDKLLRELNAEHEYFKTHHIKP